MLVLLYYYDVKCNIPDCGWSLCYFGTDPWEAQVSCPEHGGYKHGLGNKPNDTVTYTHVRKRFDERLAQAYGAMPITPDCINEHGTVELWRAKRNGFPA